MLPRSATDRRFDQMGSGTLLVAGVSLVVLLLTAMVAIVAGYVVAAHAARGAADLVALSAAAEQSRGGRACAVAGRIAQANRVRLVECRVRGDSLDFVVSVTLARPVAGLPLLPDQVLGTARAGRLGLG